MNLAIPSVPGFWPDYYLTYKEEIINTIKRMVEHSGLDYPNSTLAGFTITKSGDKHDGLLYRIYPEVKTPKFTHDFFTGTRS